jgi:predicted DNA-binding antitoxin AbrB/MazE fold protein
MIAITTTVVYEDGVLRPTEKLDLPDHHLYRAVILPYEREQHTLADVLGFDPNDEQSMREAVEKQQQAVRAFVGSATTDESDDASIRHDEYLYGLGR